MSDSSRAGSESEGHHIGTRWGNKCPQCDHVETRDYGPGRYPSADRCPQCDWPMNCVDLDVIDQEPKRQLVTDGGVDQSEAGADQVYSEVRAEDWADIRASEFVDYVEGVRSFGLVFEDETLGLHGIKFDKGTGALKPVSFKKDD